MVEAVMSFTVIKPYRTRNSCFRPPTNADLNLQQLPKSVRQSPSSRFNNGWLQNDGGGGGILKRRSKRGCLSKVKAIPADHWPLMAVLVEPAQGVQRVLITHKSIWHLSDDAIKNVYVFYMMFTAWGCCVFGSTKDPFYDSEYYRKDGGDGSGHWVYEKQEQMEEKARAELWREELIEEIEQKVGGLRELEEAKGEEEEELVTK